MKVEDFMVYSPGRVLTNKTPRRSWAENSRTKQCVMNEEQAVYGKDIFKVIL